jgi:hypothetical protein
MGPTLFSGVEDSIESSYALKPKVTVEAKLGGSDDVGGGS